jgi:hypothetical protein
MRVAFSAGSHVLWTPVYITPSDELKYTKPMIGGDGWTEGWLASRSPPYRSTRGPSGLDIDVTSLVLAKKSERVEVLYDKRFLLTFNLHGIPENVIKRLGTSSGKTLLVVTATGKYFLPRLVLRSSNGDDVEDVGISGPALDAGSGYGQLDGVGWANWRLARVYQ